MHHLPNKEHPMDVPAITLIIVLPNFDQGVAFNEENNAVTLSTNPAKISGK